MKQLGVEKVSCKERLETIGNARAIWLNYKQWRGITSMLIDLKWTRPMSVWICFGNGLGFDSFEYEKINRIIPMYYLRKKVH